ncbi:hypothetical protein AQUSIP_08830 [Aquicella siphonis]|uniref:Uncharacterized protein n=1 Tax=Aquicella siphonis TaxID=254247 RepID=A0A5E4PGW0_9COXI|nr:hypothetical protein [Aquicella siphonis]VVC75593.1 hypothetical protein AQUSIP_08830 [Aquicella siphonis]
MKILVLLFLTIAIELMIAGIIKRYLFDTSITIRDYVIAIIAVNLVSFPLAWTLFKFLSFDFELTPWEAFFPVELLVILIEAGLLKLQLKASLSNCVIVSVCMNVVSAAIGVLI